MKKNLLFLFLMLFGIGCATAEPVGIDKARTVALNFLKMADPANAQLSQQSLVDITSTTPFHEFYVFSVQEKGFILVSGDDCALPILGYSLDNLFVGKDMPENVKGWLDDYENQIKDMKSENIPPSPEVNDMWGQLYGNSDSTEYPPVILTAVSPLLTTTWSQGSPYNNLCPYDNTNNARTIVGCAATAMAQVMKYWNHPTTGVGSHTYTHSTLGTISANFGATTYNWSNMPNSLTSSSSTTQKNAVALLCFHCGVAVNMNYGVSASGASSTAVGNALRNYFKYDCRNAYLSDYTTSDWIALLKNELDNNRPIIYVGTGSGGHAFIFDGYNNSNQFHVNWGWAGYCDGYFAIGSLNPGGHNYNSNNMAVIGLEPSNCSYIPSYDHSITPSTSWNTHSSSTTATCWKIYRINATANNEYVFKTGCEDGATANFDTYLYLYDSDGNLLTYNDDYCSSKSKIEYTPSQSGYIYLKVSGYGSAYGSYTLAYKKTVYYTITASASPSSGGSVSGGGTFASGNTCTLTATPASGYTFVNWKSGSSVVSTSATYSFSVTSNRTLTAYFTSTTPTTYTISASANPTGGGTVTGGGTFNSGATCTLRATPNTNYTFTNWTSGSTVLSTNATYSFTVNANKTIKGNFTYTGDCTIDNSDLPYSNNFDSYTTSTTAKTGVQPPCWTLAHQDVTMTDAYKPMIYYDNSIAHSGNYSLILNKRGIYAMPYVTMDVNRLKLTFYLRQTQEKYQLQVGVMSDLSDASTFVPVATLDNTSTTSSVFQTVNFDTYTGLGHYIAFRNVLAPGNTGDYSCNYIDDLTLAVNTTACTLQVSSLPYTNNFNSYTTSTTAKTGVEPPCWTLAHQDVTMTDEYKPMIYYSSANAHSGNYSLLLNKRGIYAMPYLSGSVSNLQLSMYVKQSQTKYQLEVGVMTNLNNASTFTPVATINNSGTGYVLHTISFASYTGSGRYIAFRNTLTAGNTGDFSCNYIDDLTLSNTSTYTITATASPTAGGSISGAGTYTSGSTCTLVATPASGYAFTNWTSGSTVVSTNATYSFTVTANRTLKANFVRTYTITASANPTAGGTVTGGGTYNSGATCTLRATAASGYVFTNWTSGTTVLSSNSTYSFTVSANKTIKANFTRRYTITASANPSTGGTVTGGGTFNSGATCTLRATPNTNYTFTNWTSGSTVLSTNATYSFTVSANKTIKGNFTYVGDCSIDESDLPYSDNFDSYTTSTTAKTGYTLPCWTLAHQDVTMTDEYKPMVYYGNSYSGNYSLILNKRGIYAMPRVSMDVNRLKLQFYVKQTAAKYQLQVGVMTDLNDASTFTPVATINNSSTTESVLRTVTFSNYTGLGHYIAFRNILASGNTGDYSLNYIDNLSLSLNTSACTLYVSNLPYTENFDSYTTSTTAKTGVEPPCWNLAQQDVTMTDEYKPMVYYASANAHSGSYSLILNKRGIYTMPYIDGSVRNLQLSMYVKQPQTKYQLQVGVMSNLNDASTFTPVATINNSGTGYVLHTVSFSSYTGSGRYIAFRNILASGNTGDFSLNYIDDLTLSNAASYTITATANPTAGGSVTGAGTYTSGSTCTLRATPASGYTFTNWTSGSTVVSTNATYSFTVTSNRTLRANFTATAPTTYTITASANPTAGGSVSGAGTFTSGSTCTLRAVPNTNYTFTNWTSGSTVVSTNATYSFTVTSNRTLKANFTYTPSCQIQPSDLPYFDNFNSYTSSTTAKTGVEPACWTLAHQDVSMTNEYKPMIYYSSANAHSGNYSLILNKRGIYAMPQYTGDVSTLQVSFYLMQTKSTYGLIVGVMSDLSNPSTFVPVATIYNSSTTAIEHYVIDLSSYTGNGHYIAFRNINSAVSDFSCNFIDDLTLSLSNSSCVIHAADMPYSDNFDSYTTSTTAKTGVEPTCWTLAHQDVAMTDEYKPMVYYSSANAHSGNYSLILNKRGIYAMPRVDCDVNTLQISMYVKQPQSKYQLQVGVMTDLSNPSSFVPVTTVNNGGTSSEHVTVSFASYSGTGHYIAFRNILASGQTGDYSLNYIDDLTLSVRCAIHNNELPWVEGFENHTTSTVAKTGVEPLCWTLVHRDVSMTTEYQPMVYYNASCAHSGNYSLILNKRGIYAMPAVIASVNTLQMELYVRQTQTKYQLQVGVLTDPGDYTSFVPVATLDNGSNITTSQRHVVNFASYTGNGHYIAFRNVLASGQTGDYSCNYIDDINLRLATSSNMAENDAKSDVTGDNSPDRHFLTVYPNPASEKVTVAADDEIVRVDLFDYTGRCIAVIERQNVIDLSRLAPGIYTLRVTLPERIEVRRVVKQ